MGDIPLWLEMLTDTSRDLIRMVRDSRDHPDDRERAERVKRFVLGMSADTRAEVLLLLANEIVLTTTPAPY